MWAMLRGVTHPGQHLLPVGHQVLGHWSAATSRDPPAHMHLHTGNELPAVLPGLTLTRCTPVPVSPRGTCDCYAGRRTQRCSCWGCRSILHGPRNLPLDGMGKAVQAAASQKSWYILRYLRALSNSSRFSSPEQHMAILQWKRCIRPALSCFPLQSRLEQSMK